MLIDTHCHFDVEDFDDDRAEVTARTLAAGVDTVVIPGYVARYWPRLLALCGASQSPRLLPALGLHPCYIAEHEAQHLQELEGLLQSRPGIIAVGEIGLDYFLPELKSAELKLRQQDVFRAQLELASRYGRPVLLHVRKAHADVIRMLRETRFREGGIVHAFSGGGEEARHYIKLGLHLGIGGPLTYEQSRRLRAVVNEVPLAALVLETDAPDMTPQPHRQAGERTRNSPEFLPSVAAALARLKNVSLQEVETITRRQSVAALKLRDEHD